MGALTNRLLQAIEEIQRMRHAQQSQAPATATGDVDSPPASAPASAQSQQQASGNCARKRTSDSSTADAASQDPKRRRRDAAPSHDTPQPNGPAAPPGARDTTPADAAMQDPERRRSDTEAARADPYATVHDNGDSYTKLRPGALEMLAALRQCCELRIFTMGDSRYACAMASLLDSSGALFRNRIVARDDANQAHGLKGLEKTGAMPPLTVVIDDTAGALPPPGLGCCSRGQGHRTALLARLIHPDCLGAGHAR